MPSFAAAQVSQPANCNVFQLSCSELTQEDVSDDELVEIVASISDEIFNELPRLAAASQFVDFLQGLQSQVYPGPNGIVQDCVSHLLEIADVVHVADVYPDILPEPSTKKVLGLATIQARCGGKFVARTWSGAIAEKLAPLRIECLSLRALALQIPDYLQQISAKLKICTTPICQTIESLLSLQRQMCGLASGGARHIKTYNLALLRNLLDLGPFSSAMDRLLDLPSTLEPIIAEVRVRVKMIQLFVANAPDEVEASFKLPFPASMVQGAIIGDEPPMKQSLLQQLDSMHEVALGDVVEMLDMLSESLSALNVDTPVDQVKDFVDHAAANLSRLESVCSGQAKCAQLPHFQLSCKV